MSGVSNKMSAAVFRLKYGGESRFYADALTVVKQESRKLFGRFESGDGEQCYRLCKLALNHWLNDRCVECDGLGYGTIMGAPVLSNVACQVCDGAGKVPVPSMGSKLWDDRIAALLARIEHMEVMAAIDVVAKLR